MADQRAAAVAALLAFVVAVLVTVVEVVQEWQRGLVVAALTGLALVAAWLGVRRRGTWRVASLAASALLVVAAVVLVILGRSILVGLVAIGLLLLSLAAAKRAFAVHVRLPRAEPPSHPVVVWNPKSGGGKALSNNLAEEARKRGIEPIELKPGDDLVVLVRDAVARGANGLAAAGGDGTQALVATLAAEHDLPFACIPAGTRNHFALDLGVDRDDVVGALDAFVNGGERIVDLAEVNGRVFVNNASLGLYAEAVQREGYRDAKLRTILDTAPDVLGNEDSGARAELGWTGADGVVHTEAAVILVSNNVYRLGHAIGSGTRPRMDAGVLGVAALKAPNDSGSASQGAHADSPRRPLQQWSTTAFTVDSASPVPVGVDGEALVLDPPLRFTIRPAALRVRIAPQHPGASPSAAYPSGLREAVGQLLALSLGRA